MDLSCEERAADSLFVERIWRSKDDNPGAFISIANGHWGMVVSRIHGKNYITVRGPETRATPGFQPDDAEFFGIEFKPGTLMPMLPAATLMDRCDANLPHASSQSFWLNGSTWQFPDYENVETFVDWLVRDDLLIYDPLVGAVLEGRPVDASLRTVQRRFLQATGITYNTVRSIERAREATVLLKQGVSILDTVYRAGYADQPHMTRSLKHFIGQTPAQIANANRSERLSFLFKTHVLV
ncbi:MAG: helix-turn-helix domain-containing protein [Chloroflexi bacterium]|nr:helix-turn-helix domain-containing protein [Chloroflexota bacterium]